MINGKMGLEIKKIIKEKPTISIRKVEGILKSGLFNDKPIPTRSTIHKFLKDNQLEKSTLLQKVPISDVNKKNESNLRKNGLLMERTSLEMSSGRMKLRFKHCQMEEKLLIGLLKLLQKMIELTR